MKKIIITLSLLKTFSSGACTDLPGLEEKMMNSSASASEILVSTMNRLGYGIHSRSWLNSRLISNIEQKFGKRVAIYTIAGELRAAFSDMSRAGYFPFRTISQTTPGNNYMNVYQPLNTIKSYRNELVRNGQTHFNIFQKFKSTQRYRKILDSLNIARFNPQGKILDVWRNHFNIDSNVSSYSHVNFEVSLKKKSCSTFQDMLLMTTHHPAMLKYLNNNLNTKEILDNSGNIVSSLNENYGREIIELHTLGTGPITGYDEEGNSKYAYYVGDAHEYDEVLEATKVLTGFKYRTNNFQFLFDSSLHEQGSKVFPKLFGRRVVIGEGYEESLRFLKLLARHNRTKVNVCEHLVKSIYGFHPGRGTVASCIQAYGNKGNLANMYKSIIVNDVFFNPTLFGKGIKTPLESVVGAARALGLKVPNLTTLPSMNKVKNIISGIKYLGEDLYNYPAPTGQFFDSSLLSSSVYVTNRIDVYKNITLDSNLKYWARENKELEAFIESKISNISKANLARTILSNAAPVFSDRQKNSLQAPTTQLLTKPDKERNKPIPVKSSVLRAYASGAGLRK